MITRLSPVSALDAPPATRLPANSFSGWGQQLAERTIDFQHASGINKAVLDVIGIDVPMLVVAKTNLERKERAFQQALVFVAAFMLAPFHASLFSKFFARKLPSRDLFRLSFKALGDNKAFAKGIESLYTTQLKEPMPAALKQILKQAKHPAAIDALRNQVIRAKTAFMGLDLTVESVLMGGIGPMKVLFGQWISGKKGQFSGEIGLVEQQKLDTIYEQERGWLKVPKAVKELIPMAVGTALTIAAVVALRVSMLKPLAKGGTRPYSLFAKIGDALDYRYLNSSKTLGKVPFISDGALVLLSIPLSLGQIFAARSPREFKEMLILRSALEGSFFLTLPWFMKLATASLRGKYGIRPAMNLKKVLSISKIPKRFDMPAKQALTRIYWLGFALNTGLLAWVIHACNQMTRKSLGEKAKQIHTGQKAPPIKTGEKAQRISEDPYLRRMNPYQASLN